MSKDILVVTGETGVGKDFLLDHANMPPHAVNRANWGDLFSAIAEEDKDSLSHEVYLPGEEATETIQRTVCQQVIDMQPVVVTSHPVKVIKGVPHVNWAIEAELDPHAYFFVQASPELIAERVKSRNALGQRKSKVRSVAEIADSQNQKAELMKGLAAEIGVRLITLSSAPEDCAVSIEKLAAAMAELKMGKQKR